MFRIIVVVFSFDCCILHVVFCLLSFVCCILSIVRCILNPELGTALACSPVRDISTNAHAGFFISRYLTMNMICDIKSILISTLTMNSRGVPCLIIQKKQSRKSSSSLGKKKFWHLQVKNRRYIFSDSQSKNNTATNSLLAKKHLLTTSSRNCDPYRRPI